MHLVLFALFPTLNAKSLEKIMSVRWTSTGLCPSGTERFWVKTWGLDSPFPPRSTALQHTRSAFRHTTPLITRSAANSWTLRLYWGTQVWVSGSPLLEKQQISPDYTSSRWLLGWILVAQLAEPHTVIVSLWVWDRCRPFITPCYRHHYRTYTLNLSYKSRLSSSPATWNIV